MDTPKNVGGRPKLPPEEKALRGTVALLPHHWEKVRLYGVQWLRDLVDKGKPPQGWKPPAE